MPKSLSCAITNATLVAPTFILRNANLPCLSAFPSGNTNHRITALRHHQLQRVIHASKLDAKLLSDNAINTMVIYVQEPKTASDQLIALAKSSHFKQDRISRLQNIPLADGTLCGLWTEPLPPSAMGPNGLTRQGTYADFSKYFALLDIPFGSISRRSLVLDGCVAARGVRLVAVWLCVC
jgi:ribosomal protein L17